MTRQATNHDRLGYGDLPAIGATLAAVCTVAGILIAPAFETVRNLMFGAVMIVTQALTPATCGPADQPGPRIAAVIVIEGCQ